MYANPLAPNPSASASILDPMGYTQTSFLAAQPHLESFSTKSRVGSSGTGSIYHDLDEAPAEAGNLQKSVNHAEDEQSATDHALAIGLENSQREFLDHTNQTILRNITKRQFYDYYRQYVNLKKAHKPSVISNTLKVALNKASLSPRTRNEELALREYMGGGLDAKKFTEALLTSKPVVVNGRSISGRRIIELYNSTLPAGREAPADPHRFLDVMLRIAVTRGMGGRKFGDMVRFSLWYLKYETPWKTRVSIETLYSRASSDKSLFAAASDVLAIVDDFYKHYLVRVNHALTRYHAYNQASDRFAREVHAVATETSPAKRRVAIQAFQASMKRRIALYRDPKAAHPLSPFDESFKDRMIAAVPAAFGAALVRVPVTRFRYNALIADLITLELHGDGSRSGFVQAWSRWFDAMGRERTAAEAARLRAVNVGMLPYFMIVLPADIVFNIPNAWAGSWNSRVRIFADLVYLFGVVIRREIFTAILKPFYSEAQVEAIYGPFERGAARVGAWLARKDLEQAVAAPMATAIEMTEDGVNRTERAVAVQELQSSGVVAEGAEAAAVARQTITVAEAVGNASKGLFAIGDIISGIGQVVQGSLDISRHKHIIRAGILVATGAVNIAAGLAIFASIAAGAPALATLGFVLTGLSVIGAAASVFF